MLIRRVMSSFLWLVVLPTYAYAGDLYKLSISKDSSSQTDGSLPKIAIKVQNISLENIHLRIHGHAYSDYKILLQRDDGTVVSKTTSGMALVGEAAASLPSNTAQTHFIPMVESGLDKQIDPGVSFVEVVDLNKLYDVPSGKYTVVFQGRLQDPSGDPILSNSLQVTVSEPETGKD